MRNPDRAESKKAFIHELLTKKATSKAPRASILLTHAEEEEQSTAGQPETEKRLQ